MTKIKILFHHCFAYIVVGTAEFDADTDSEVVVDIVKGIAGTEY